MSLSIYDLLNKQSLDYLTISNLEAATGRTAIDTASVEFWKGILTPSHVMKAARTYPHGIVIPETGLVEVVTVADSATESIKPTGTEVWRVENIDLDNCVAGFFDGTRFSPIPVAAPFNSPPFFISASCWLAFSNASGSEQTPSIAYFKVSL